MMSPISKAFGFVALTAIALALAVGVRPALSSNPHYNSPYSPPPEPTATPCPYGWHGSPPGCIAPTPTPTASPTQAPTPNPQQLQTLKNTITALTPNLLGVAISQNYALAAIGGNSSTDDNAIEEVWVLESDGNWYFVSRTGGAFSLEVLVHQFSVPSDIAQALLNNLDGMKL